MAQLRGGFLIMGGTNFRSADFLLRARFWVTNNIKPGLTSCIWWI